MSWLLSWLVWGWTIRKGWLFHTAIDCTSFSQNHLSWLVWGWTIRKGWLFHTAIDCASFSQNQPTQNQDWVRSGFLWSAEIAFTCNLLRRCCLTEQKLHRFRYPKNCTGLGTLKTAPLQEWTKNGPFFVCFVQRKIVPGDRSLTTVDAFFWESINLVLHTVCNVLVSDLS